MHAGPGRTPGGVALLRHPGSAAGPVVSLGAVPGRGAGGALVVRYRLAADLARLRVPAPAPPHRADGLWRHTCFEAFIRRAGEEAYREFNFSPSGAWAAYAFRRYREGGSNLTGGFVPNIQVHRGADLLELLVGIPYAFLPPGPAEVPLRLGLSAVVEDQDGVLSYWALRHPPDKPDFHHPDAFVFELREES